MGYDKAKLAGFLKTIYDNTHEGVDEPENRRRAKVLGGEGTRIAFESAKGGFEGVIGKGGGPTLSVIDDGVDAIDRFVGEVLHDQEFRDVIGAGAVEQQLTSLLRSTEGKMPSDDLKDMVRHRVLKPLREEIRPWIVFVPIINLAVERPLAMGDVEFVSPQTAEEESRAFIGEHQFAGTPDNQKQQAGVIVGQIESSSRQHSGFVRVKLRVHENRVAAVAADKALIVVNILRSHTHLFHRHNHRALIGLPSELSRGFWQTMAIGQDEMHKFSMQNQNAGALLPFVLNDFVVGHLTDKCHLGLMQEILAKAPGDRTSLEAVLVQAFQPLGRAIVAPTNDSLFLGCTIALERMLIRDGEETTTERWADRLALTLSDDPARRMAIIQRAKRLYDLRSQMVHAAFSGVFEEDAQLMERWAVSVVLSTLGRHTQFPSHESFCRSVDPREIGLGGA